MKQWRKRELRQQKDFDYHSMIGLANTPYNCQYELLLLVTRKRNSISIYFNNYIQLVTSKSHLLKKCKGEMKNDKRKTERNDSEDFRSNG